MKNDDKTEKPTAHKRREAERSGSIARSADVGSLFGIIGVVVVVLVVVPSIAPRFGARTAALFAAAAQGPTAPGFRDAVIGLATMAIVPVVALAAGLALVGGLIQSRGKIAPKAVKPKLSNLSLKKGIQKFSPKQVGWELVRNLLKLALLALVAIAPISSLLGSLDTLKSLPEWFDFARGLMSSILIRALLLAALIAIADYAWSRYRVESQLKMSKQEVKDEHKNREGDPRIKGRRRSKMLELSRNRAIAAVGQADVVIVNPVRFAVALRYDPAEPAPRVVAKGAGALARRIRSEAYRHGVPVRQDPPLARALFRRCEVGQFVPAALFEAVAVVLAAIYRRRWRRDTRVAVGAGR